MNFFAPYYKGPKSFHFDGKRFFNPWNPKNNSFLDFLKWKFTSKASPWPTKIENKFSDIPPKEVYGSELRVSFVGHATVLIQTEGLNILTDPIWSEWASPMEWKRTKRVTSPGIHFENLPKIDIVLISHNHYDHLDEKTIIKLWKRDSPLIIAPLGNDTIIQGFDPTIKVHTLDWDQSIRINENVEIILQPAQHWSSRKFFDRNMALWGAFVIKTPSGNVYYSGDTGYGEGINFKKAQREFGNFRFAILPIGCYEPRWFMKYVHTTPAEAIKAYHDLGDPYTMAMHFGTFRLADEGYDTPVEDLKREMKNQNIPQDKFRALAIGESWFIPQ